MATKAKSSIFHFFLTDTGRQVVTFAAGTTTLGLFLGNYLPHTLLLQKYKEFVCCYQSGIQRTVPSKVLEKVEIALERLNIPAHERPFVKPFTVFGFDLFQAGSTNYRFGGLLGIPVNFAYDTLQDMNLNDIRFRDKAIDWTSQSGKYLQESLVLTPQEQVFGICKCILQLQSQRVLLNSVFPSLSFLSMYTLGRYFNVKLNLYARPLSLRLVLYSILGLFGVGQWSFMKDFTQLSYDADIDKKLSTLGPEFVAAGVSFYDKLLKRNMALRELLGDDTYTARGNENYTIRQKSLPLTIRKSFFEEKWKEINGVSDAGAAMA